MEVKTKRDTGLRLGSVVYTGGLTPPDDQRGKVNQPPHPDAQKKKGSNPPELTY